MGFTGFVTWFIVGLVGTVTLMNLFSSPFLVGFIVASIMGVLGSRE